MEHWQRDFAGIWERAKSHAGCSEKPVQQYPFPGDPGDRPSAMYYALGWGLDEYQGEVLTSEQRRDFLGSSQSHRILIWTGTKADVLGPKLRHELEHLRQWTHYGDEIFDLYDAALAATERFSPDLREGRGRIYNLVPPEVDANGAAALLARDELSVERCEELANSDDGALFREENCPRELSTLAVRTLCFAAIGRSQAEAAVNFATFGGSSVRRELWDRLGRDAELDDLLKAADKAVPTREDIEAASPLPGRAWVPLEQRIREAFRRAFELAELDPPLP